MVAGAYFRAIPDPQKFAKCADGHREGQLWMRHVRKQLSTVEPYRRFEGSPDDRSETVGANLLGTSGWLNFLYAHLSGFSHGRPFYVSASGNRLPSSNVELWGGSNGRYTNHARLASGRGSASTLPSPIFYSSG